MESIEPAESPMEVSNSVDTTPSILDTVHVSDSVPEPSVMSTVTSSLPPWDPTPPSPQIMPTLTTSQQQPSDDASSSGVHLEGIEVTFPVGASEGVVQQISTPISQPPTGTKELSNPTTQLPETEMTSIEDPSDSVTTDFELVSVPDVSDDTANGANPSVGEISSVETMNTSSATPSTSASGTERGEVVGSSESTCITEQIAGPSQEPSVTKSLLPVHVLNIESEEALAQVQKLLEQAVSSCVAENSLRATTKVDTNTNVTTSSSVTTSTVAGTELPQPSTSNPAYQSNIEAVVEMLLETAKSLSGLINSEEPTVKPSTNNTTSITTDNNGAGSSTAQDSAAATGGTSHIDSLPGPSGLQQDSGDPSSTQVADEGKESQGLHANKEIQRLLDALLTTAASQDGGRRGTNKRDSDGTKIHKCPECDKYFPRLSSLKRHVLLHMDSRPFQCDQCEANYKSASQLNRHKRLHSGEKPAKCEFCNKDFRTYNELYVHRRTHTGEKPFECQYCGKFFSTRGYRNTHERIHTGEKRFECDFCGMKFTESSARRVHRFTHTGETPYKCTVCGRGFTQAGNLNKHVKTMHSEGKPFKCQNCDKSFSIKQELHRHFQRAHSTDKPHKCKVCDKRYAILSDLTHHVRTHTYRCAKCGSKFKDSSELEQHIIEVCVVPDGLPGEGEGEEESGTDTQGQGLIKKRTGRKKSIAASENEEKRPKRQQRSKGDHTPVTKKRKTTESSQPPQSVEVAQADEITNI